MKRMQGDAGNQYDRAGVLLNAQSTIIVGQAKVKKMQFRHQFVRSLFTSVTWWLGVAASLVAFHFANQMVERERRNQFDYHASNAELAIESRIHSYIDVLRATRAMFHAKAW
jgi:CHASE1-domain containing sensor protein